jgi:hypothetical protein
MVTRWDTAVSYRGDPASAMVGHGWLRWPWRDTGVTRRVPPWRLLFAKSRGVGRHGSDTPWRLTLFCLSDGFPACRMLHVPCPWLTPPTHPPTCGFCSFQRSCAVAAHRGPQRGGVHPASWAARDSLSYRSTSTSTQRPVRRKHGRERAEEGWWGVYNCGHTKWVRDLLAMVVTPLSLPATHTSCCLASWWARRWYGCRTQPCPSDVRVALELCEHVAVGPCGRPLGWGGHILTRSWVGRPSCKLPKHLVQLADQ